MANKKSTKRALFSSALATVMCAAMLIGTTFAWFTDTASTAVNKIQSGDLHVELLAEDGITTLEGSTLEWQKAEGAEDEEILWEPGCTYKLQPIVIKNGGNLALKYKIVINGIDGDAKLSSAIEWTIGGVSLDEEKRLLPDDFDTLTIEAHMKESAGNDYQNLSIDGIGITVYATQDTVEYDSETNTYDENAAYSVVNVDELKTAITNGGTVALGSDIEMTPVATDEDKNASKLHLVQQMAVNTDTVLDLSGKVISITEEGRKADYGNAAILLMAVKDGTLTINGDGEINCESDSSVYGISINGETAKVVINDGDFYGSITAIQVQKGDLEINGGFFDLAPTCKEQLPQYAKYIVNCIDSAYKDGTASITIKGGTFVNFDPSNNPEGQGTSYVADGYKVVSTTQTNGDVWYTVVAE